MTCIATTATPCARCHTTGGRVPKGKARPYRVQGLCSNCHSRCWKRMKARGLATLAEAIDLDDLSPRPARPVPPDAIYARPHFREVWEEAS